MVIQYSDKAQQAMDEAEKRAVRLLALVGLSTLNWNSVEETLESLIWFYLGSEKIGHIITSRMQNMSRCDVLTALAAAKEGIPRIQERVTHFVKAFDVLRVNRNAIVHSVKFTLDAENNTLWLEKVRRSIRTREYDTYSMPAEALEKLADQMAELDEFGKTVLEIMRRRSGLIEQPFFDWRSPPPWPEMFALPEKLNSLPD